MTLSNARTICPAEIGHHYRSIDAVILDDPLTRRRRYQPDFLTSSMRVDLGSMN
jgi:hypothetical protein